MDNTKIFIPLLVSVLSVLFVNGCQSVIEAPERTRKNEKSIRLLKQKINVQTQLIRRQIASTSESNAYYEEQIRKLNARIDYLNENYSNILKIINELRQLIAQRGQNTKNLEQELQKLRSELIKERDLRKKEMNKVVDVVTKETVSAINKIARQRRISDKSHRGGGVPVGSGKFYVYTVQKGATLSAIAKAYKVTVEDIRKANRLKGYIIRIGQKLYIPKK